VFFACDKLPIPVASRARVLKEVRVRVYGRIQASFAPLQASKHAKTAWLIAALGLTDLTP
jgi:hypothetical protein